MSRTSLWARTDQFIVDEIKRAAGSAPVSLTPAQATDRKMAMYRGDWTGQVDEAIVSLFQTEEVRAHLRLHLHTATNILQGVIDETCLVYQEPPTRYIKGAEVDERAVRATATGQIAELLTMSDEEILAQDTTPPAEGAGAPEPQPTVGKPAPPAPAPAPAGGPTMAEAQQPEADALAPPLEATDAQTALERLLEAVDLDGVMEEAHHLSRFLRAVWLMPVVRADPTPDDPKHMKLDVDVYTESTSWVETDPADPTQAIAFWTKREEKVNGETRTVKYKWTRDRFEKYDENDHKIPNDLRPDEINELGRLPVTVVRLKRPLDTYWIEGQGDDLYDATLEVAVLRTLQNARYRDSSFKQIVIDGDPKDMPAGQVMSLPMHPIYTAEGSASVLDIQANLEQMSSTVRERIQDIVVRHGISLSSWQMSEKSQSGFSKKMDQAKVAKINRKERKHLADAERDLYRLIAEVLRFHPVKEIGALDPKAELVVDYAEPVYEEDPLTQARSDAINLRLGLTNPLDIIMRENPDLTAREAMQALVLNRAIRQRFMDDQGMSLIEALTQVQGNKAAASAGEAAAKPKGGFGNPSPEPGNLQGE